MGRRGNWRSKRIGKNWSVSIRFKDNKADVWITDYKNQWRYYYNNIPETKTNHHALAIYNSLNTVKQIKEQLEGTRPKRERLM